MLRSVSALVLVSVCGTVAAQQAAQPLVGRPAWIARSDSHTRALLDVELRHSPEEASEEGVAEFDQRISDPTLADQLAARREYTAVLAGIRAARATETDPHVREDIEILLKAFDLRFREEDYALLHEVPFNNASSNVFEGLHALLDDQVSAQRRLAALVRLREYAGTQPGYQPFTQRLQQRELEQMAKPGVEYPARDQIETELGRDANYLDGIAALFKKYRLTNWEADFAKLRTELIDYDAWIRANVLPKARRDFRLPPQRYALALEDYGVDIPAAQIATQAHAAFIQYQSEMAPIAAQIAKAHGYPDSDYRAVILRLKAKQITGTAILPFYEHRLHQIEDILVAKQLITLPRRPAIIRLATAAETVQEPAPHMKAPPLLHNTGQRGEFVLPLNIPSATGGTADKYDDFTFDAVSWTLTAHEARPGHELQFDSMVENGVSLARAFYAFNSTNAEGWGLYSEYIMQPYEPPEGQLITLQLRLLRAARAFLDPELQSGQISPARAYEVLEKDVILSHAFAKEEVERFTFHAPGQANSYFYGYTRLLSLRKEVEGILGNKFNQKKFHDFILSQGLLPPDLLRKAALQEFVPAQR
jgi:uncharacterized protein (DUF885 family)